MGKTAFRHFIFLFSLMTLALSDCQFTTSTVTSSPRATLLAPTAAPLAPAASVVPSPTPSPTPTPSRAPTATPTPISTSCVPAPSSSAVTDVKTFGAKGDGVTDDTAAIQRAIDAVTGTGGTLFISDGTYRVNPVFNPSMGGFALYLKSNMTLRLSSGAVIKALATSASQYQLIMATGTNINLVGGTIEGERSIHNGTTGESGMCVSVNNASNIVVEGVTSKECWGDGFYITNGSSNATFCSVTSDHNRRQGMSIVSGTNITVKNSVFKNTGGTAPEAGIDIEPNANQKIDRVTISNNLLLNNAGGGFQSGVPDANTATASTTNIVFDGNTVSSNGFNFVDGLYKMGILITNSDGTQITNNNILNNAGEGIRLTDNATHTLVRGNTISGTSKVSGQEYWTGQGILLSTCAGSTVTGNSITGNAGTGIWQLIADSSVTITGNTLSNNGP